MIVAEPTIIHWDAALIVIDKPCDLLAVPGRGPDKQDCAVSRIRRHFPDLPDQPAVHRLDMQTSGLMLLARTAAAHRHLARQFAERQVRKRYLAVINGLPKHHSGTIELAFRLDPNNRPCQVYDPINGKKGITHWRTIGPDPRGTRIEFRPVTGRTHQLRLHAAHPLGLNAPIVGDRLYGRGCLKNRLLLHACFLQFIHPLTLQPQTCFSPPPF